MIQNESLASESWNQGSLSSSYASAPGSRSLRILAIADDLTGALEVGAKFAIEGWSAWVTSSSPAVWPFDAHVLVISTATRHVSADQAFRTVEQIAITLGQQRPTVIYKKTDSTLRGNIGAELHALSQAFPSLDVIFVPAYPRMGRTVCGGHLFVDGVPVHQTAFAADPLNPVKDSSVQGCLGGIPATILDGKTTADIEQAAKQISTMSPLPIVAGPSAIAEALARSIHAEEPVRRPLPTVHRCLVVNGSQHPRSGEQVRDALLKRRFGDTWSYFEYSGSEVGEQRAQALGKMVRKRIESDNADGILVFGGDTAGGIHQAFGSPPFESVGEALPGIPVSRCAGLTWITKAGGFGPVDLIEQLRYLLR